MHWGSHSFNRTCHVVAPHTESVWAEPSMAVFINNDAMKYYYIELYYIRVT